MFTKEQREKIRSINRFEVFYSERKGIPYSFNKPVDIPDVWSIKQDAINKILQLGFKKVESVAPKDANCIIRVYTKRHFKYQMSEIHNVYGFDCFVKEDGKWISKANNIFQINFSKHIIKHLIWQDESVDYDCDFVDCYVKIV